MAKNDNVMGGWDKTINKLIDDMPIKTNMAVEPTVAYKIAVEKPLSEHRKVIQALETIEKYCYNREDACHNCIFADEFDCPTALEYYLEESKKWLKRKASELERLEQEAKT